MSAYLSGFDSGTKSSIPDCKSQTDCIAMFPAYIAAGAEHVCTKSKIMIK